ncbi:hypothetical protein BU24DRAFT_488641 [Aaosphaeria arxii CBS 175.79]|uniref:Heterokaryon incompatibility domain-containing protein n=1 Tax=Aaosphaeria arxii CBS 175.79 TaxID=1450172 RepID=A0A6A5YA29_9PLEO|nr:uncharacterized protein BU24DRAFT_488641 [Aaosphaeria arxii CBS 175.79]KAF2022432.1 hypothetical protein BU24DRAFT_488641 [Aaosphaeria arxii CBS 175.79]
MISMNGDQPSLNFHSLLKLIDMFHTHEASDPRDKVYALLNLAVHDNPAQLLRPDYELSWKQVFRQLIETFVSIDEDTKLHTWDDQRIAMIQTEGGLLGHVTEARGNKEIQSIGVEIWDTTPVRYRGRLSKYFSQGIKNFRLSRGAKDICAGDLLCVL